MKVTDRSWVLALVLGLAALWLGSVALAHQVPGVRTDLSRADQEHLLSQYVYPSATPYVVPGVSSDESDLSKSLVKFTTEDSSEKVIAWYLGELGMVPVPGMSSEGAFDIGGDFNKKLWDRAIAEERAFVHDYRPVEKARGTDRKGVVWQTMAEIRASGGAMYVLGVLVTRKPDEARTHIALTWFKTQM